MQTPVSDLFVLYLSSRNTDRFSNEIINIHWATCTRFANIKVNLIWNLEPRETLCAVLLWSGLNGSV